MEERRNHPRVTLVVKVTNRSTKEFHYFYSRDISMGGIFLDTRQPYSEDTEVELDFFVPLADKRQRIVASGKVIRVVDINLAEKEKILPGMGIKFNELSSEVLGIVAGYVRENLSQESDKDK
jgi:uncharacterized protein (TIGR02266 family)